MNAPHIHVALTHIPVIGIIFSGILLLIAFLTMDKKWQRVSYWFIFFVAISTIPVYLSGEPTEEIIEKLAGVSESYIEEHETIALISFITMLYHLKSSFVHSHTTSNSIGSFFSRCKQVVF